MPPRKATIKSNLEEFDWDVDEKFDLIKEVRAREQLWDHLRSDFSKRDVTDKNWREVGNSIGCKAEEAKEAWRNLRVYYRSLKKKFSKKRSGQGLDDAIVPKWIFYKEMDFLSSKGKPRESISSMDEPKEKADDDDLTEEDVLEQGGEVFLPSASASSRSSSSLVNGRSEDTTETLNSAPCTSKRQKKRHADTDESSAMVELMSTVSTAMKTKTVASADELLS